MTVTLTQSDYIQVVENSEKPVLLDVWAPTCAPCRALGPMLQDLEDQYGDQLVIAKLNADEELEAAKQLGVAGLPTLRVIQRGRIVTEFVGLPDADQLKQVVGGVMGAL
jgi:thioredoxin